MAPIITGLCLLSQFVKHNHWLLYYLFNHPKQSVASLMFRVPTTTFIENVKLSMTEFRLFDRIQFEKRKNHQSVDYQGSNVLLAVDTTDIPLRYISSWNIERNQAFSVKNHQYSLKFEVATTLDGKIVWYHGPFFHDAPDITIFRTGLRDVLEESEKVFADKGYIGEGKCITPFKKGANKTLSIQQTEHNRTVGSYRAIVENINADLKKWQVLNHFKDTDIDFLTSAFILICNLVNMKRAPSTRTFI